MATWSAAAGMMGRLRSSQGWIAARQLLLPRELAYASITFYLGVNMFTRLDADRSRTESLFTLAERVAPRAKLLTVRLPRRRA